MKHISIIKEHMTRYLRAIRVIVKKAKDTNKPKEQEQKVSYKYFVMLFGVVLVSLVQLNFLKIGIFENLIKPTEHPAVLATKHVSVTPTKAIATLPSGLTPKHIVIEKVGIDLPIISVPVKNGTWQVNPGVANYAEGTSLINTKDGNVGLFGHDRSDAFTNIKKVLTGYDIMVSGNNYKAIYRVTSASVIQPTAISVFYPTKEPTLTLITCDGLFSEKRYMVRAKLIKIEKVK